MSKYLVDKFLFTIDRDPELVERYRTDPAGTVAWWEAEQGEPDPELHRRRGVDLAVVHRRGTRRAVAHDHVALFELGAHPFLTLTLWIAMFERDYAEPLAMQLDYAARLAHFNLPYPDITT